MAPRKRDLLDVLRQKQQAQDGGERPQAVAAPRAARFRFRFGPKQRRAWIRVILVVLWLVLVVWLVRLLVGGGDAASSAERGAAPAAGMADASGSGGASAAPGFGVLAITFQSEANRQAAVDLALRLKDGMSLPDVTLHEVRDRGKVFYEIYVGRAADPAALEPLLQRVRGLALPNQPAGQFASALVKRRPPTNP